ncbi:MAG TPA: hypothetical protein VKY89_09440 [Thermoanaerobaculia bacterium]|nr:hypothetical protein [Thermoanaerobaculia bacterium]
MYQARLASKKSFKPRAAVLACVIVGVTAWVAGGPPGAARPARSERLALAALPARSALPAMRSLAARPETAPRHLQPSKEALSLAEQVRARWMGVDHAGNLWAWEPLEGSVRFFSPTAARLGTVLVPLGATAVDGDAAWGAVALTLPGAPATPGPADPADPAAPATPAASPTPPTAAAEDNGKLVWVRPGAAPGSHEELALPATVGWVCWIDQDTVALAPQRSAWRVELWNLRERKLVKRFGAEQEIVLAQGATRVREVLLRFDPARRRLYTLESYTGDLAVFSLDGKLVWRAKLDDPYRQVEEKTLADLNDRAKTRQMALGQALSALWLAEGPDGSAWVSQRIDMLHLEVNLVKVTAAGTTPMRVSTLRCPSRTFTIWGGQLVFFRDISTPREVCNSVAPLP